MKLQILNTFKCNFKCRHCMFACGPHFKEMMERDIFLKVLNCFFYMTRRDDDYVNLVGGEPFLHPDIFWQIQTLLINFEHVRIVTNGSWILTPDGNYAKKYLNLLKLQEKVYIKNLTIAISNDEFHREFWQHDFSRMFCALKNDFGGKVEPSWFSLHNNIIDIGRARENNLGNCNIKMDCNERFEPTILPNGDVSVCCMGKQIIGNVRNLMDYESIYKQLKIPEKTSKNCYDCPNYAISCLKYLSNQKQLTMSTT